MRALQSGCVKADSPTGACSLAMVEDGVNLTACRSRSAGCDMRSKEKTAPQRGHESKTAEHPRSIGGFGAELLVNMNICC